MASPPQAQLLRLRAERRLRVLIGEPTVAATGCTVFLVHGAGGRAEQWRFVWPGLLEAGHRVVAFDALGHGGSPAPQHWRAYAGSEWVADLRALVEQQGSAQNLLVGHSYGCLVVLGAMLGADLPVDCAVLLAPPAPDSMTRPPWFAYLPVPLLEAMRPKLSAGFRAAAWGADAPTVLVDEETALSDTNSLYVFKALWRQWLQLDAAALRGVTVPVQVLVGEADRLTPPDGARKLAALLPHAKFAALARCGHQFPLERPGAVVRAILVPQQA
jgi:pimeloyl-ACP methyl ester carboxylesterase